MKEASPYIYPGLADMYSQQLSAAVFISHSAYKLISCCFHLFRDPLFAVSVYWQVCYEAWRTCETAGEPKRVCSLIWIFENLWSKVVLEFSPLDCTENVPFTPAFHWWPSWIVFERIFRHNRPDALKVQFSAYPAMFEKTTVAYGAYWVKKCNGFTSQVIWITSWGQKFDRSFRIHCVKLE